MERCSRYHELANVIQFHIELAKASSAPTEFRLIRTKPPSPDTCPTISPDIDLSPLTVRIGFGLEHCEEEREGYEKLLPRLTLPYSPPGNGRLIRHFLQVFDLLTKPGLGASSSPVVEELRKNGQKAVIVLVTSGESMDGDIITAIRLALTKWKVSERERLNQRKKETEKETETERETTRETEKIRDTPLSPLPISLVIRLCTDESSIVKRYRDWERQFGVNRRKRRRERQRRRRSRGDIGGEVEEQREREIEVEELIDIDVIDDFRNEAKALYRVHPFVTYGEPLHRMREFGVRELQEIDLFDLDKKERMSREEMIDAVKLL
jgi:hypothetical protein